jgi:hypothetical protein
MAALLLEVPTTTTSVRSRALLGKPFMAVGSIKDGEAMRHSPGGGADIVVPLGLGAGVR